MRESRQGYLYMGLAVVLLSTSAIFVRWAQPLDPWTLTAGRMLMGSLSVVLISLLVRKGWRPPSRSHWPRYLLYGGIAAVHFGFYIASLGLTTIAHSLSIIHTAPIWVTLCARFCLGEPFPRHKWPGVLVTVAGIAVLTGFEPELDREMILGDLLALGSAICFGLYSVAGRSQREKLPLFSYAATVYGIAGLWILGPSLVAYQAGTLSWKSGLAVLGAAVFPLGIGHTLYNAALRRLHPTIVSIIATQEVTGGVLLGVILLGEIPSASTVLGAAIALAGVIWTLL